MNPLDVGTDDMPPPEWDRDGGTPVDTSHLTDQPCSGCPAVYARTGLAEDDWFCHHCRRAAALDERGAHEREMEQR